jgi:hypothetical protein
LHKYLYANNDPIQFIDPSGLFAGVAGIGVGMAMVSSIRIASMPIYGGIFEGTTSGINILSIIYQFKITAELDYGNITGEAIKWMLMSLPVVGPIVCMVVSKIASIGTIVSSTIGSRIHGTLKGTSRYFSDKLSALTDEIFPRMNTQKNNSYTERYLADTITKWIGELGAEAVASRLGLTKMKDFVARYHGFDMIFEDVAGIIYIVEAKGGDSTLSKTQMSQSWITKKIMTLSNSGDPTSVAIANKLQNAIGNGKLKGMVVSTSYLKEGKMYVGISDPIYEIVDYANIPYLSW